LLTISWEWFASTVKMAPRGPAKDAQHLPTEAQRTFPELVRIAKMKAQTLGTRPATLRTSVTKPATDRAEISIKKILAPTDFSPPSRKALHYALRFAEEFGSEVILLHVLEPVMPLTFEGLTMPSPAAEIESSDAAKSLKALVASARARGIAGVRAIFRRGFASHEIVEAAKDLDVDLILIATHGYTGWKHFCIGSTAERVVRAAPCPVLVVREKEHDFL
jgi:universal stress protein A